MKVYSVRLTEKEKNFLETVKKKYELPFDSEAFHRVFILAVQRESQMVSAGVAKKVVEDKNLER